jgi:hypothetical protein
MVLFLLMPKNDTVSTTDVTQQRNLQVWFVHWNWFLAVEKMFRSKAVHARFVVENVALGQVFTLGALDFPCRYLSTIVLYSSIHLIPTPYNLN